MLCKEEVVSGAVWSLTDPQIVGRPNTYLWALPSSPRASSGQGWGSLAAHQRFWSQMCTAGWGGGAGEQGEGSVPQGEGGCGPGRVSVPRGTGREGMEDNSWCLSQHLPSGSSHEELSSAQAWADTRGQISTPLRQPWDGAQPQLTQRERARARPWGHVGTEQLCPKPGLTARGRGAGGSTPEGSTCTSPAPCLQGWEMCIPREVPLPWQHQPHNTALSEVSGSAHSGLMGEAAQAALPHSESQHSHQAAHKIFSFFFIEITIKKLVNLEHL